MSLRGRILRGVGYGGPTQRMQLFLGNNDETPQPPDFALRRYYGLNVGQSLPSDVIESDSPTGRDIEIVIVFNTPLSDKRRWTEAMNALRFYLMVNPPPA